MSQFCTACGTARDGKSKFCINCGGTFDAPPASSKDPALTTVPGKVILTPIPPVFQSKVTLDPALGLAPRPPLASSKSVSDDIGFDVFNKARKSEIGMMAGTKAKASTGPQAGQGDPEPPLLPASELNDREIERAMLDGRAYWTGSILKDLWLTVRNKHPVLHLCIADPKFPITPVMRVFVYLALLLTDLFYASAAVLTAGTSKGAELYFLIILGSFNSNLISYGIEWTTKRSETSSYCCLRALGKCCAFSCCCYMLVASFGMTMLSLDLCDKPGSIRVKSTAEVPLARGGSIDLGGTYAFMGWGAEPSLACREGDDAVFSNSDCATDEFPAFRSSSNVWLVHVCDLVWAGNATSNAISPGVETGYWIFSEAADSIAPPWHAPPQEVYAIMPDMWVGAADNGLSEGPAGGIFGTDCSSGSGGCWFAFLSDADAVTYPPRQTGSFVQVEYLTLTNPDGITAALQQPENLEKLSNVYLIFIIGHCQGWFTWFLTAVPKFMMRYQKEKKRLQNSEPIKESELADLA